MASGQQKDIDSAWELAYNVVNRTGGNQTEAYRLWCEEHHMEYNPATIRHTAYHRFKKEDVRAHIQQFKMDNRERLAELRDENVALLKDISTNPKLSNKDRIAAIKELNSMCGYNQSNLNVSATADIVIEIEDF